MGERVLLVNPIRRKKAAPTRRKLKSTKRAPKMAKHRSAAQKRATAKLVAFNRSRRRLSNPLRKKRRLRRNPISKASAYRRLGTMAGPAKNPIRRRRRVRRNPIGRVHRRRVRRNPINVGGLMNSLFAPAAFAASGALALDIAFGYLPIPANLKVGALNLVTKAAGAVALSILAGKVVGKAKGQLMGVGALTVVFHDVAKAFIAGSMPSLKMAGMGYINPGYPVGGYGDSGMGVYLGANGTRSSGLPNLNGMSGVGEYVSGMGRVDNEAAYYGQ